MLMLIENFCFNFTTLKTDLCDFKYSFMKENYISICISVKEKMEQESTQFIQVTCINR